MLYEAFYLIKMLIRYEEYLSLLECCYIRGRSILITVSSTMKTLRAKGCHLFLVFALAVGEGAQSFNENLLFRKNSTENNLLKTIGNKLVKNFENLSKGVQSTCMIQVIQEALNSKANTYILIKDGKPHETLRDNLLSNFVHSYYTEPKLLRGSDSYFTSFNHLLIFGNKFNLKTIIKKLMPAQGSKFFALAKNYKEVIEIFEEMWKFRIIDVLASFLIKETIYYYAYFPYRTGQCGEVGKPQLLARCNVKSGIFDLKKKIFPQKAKNLHMCPINITFMENVPASYYGNNQKLMGWEIDLIKEMVKHLNAVPNFHVLPFRKNIYNTLNGYHRLVRNSDIGGGMAISLKGLAKTDFCMYGQSICTAWIVPRKTDVSHSAAFIFKVFPTQVWILLILSLLMMAVVCKIFIKATWSNILFKLLPYILGTATKTTKKSMLLGSIWLWFCITMNAIYQSGYKSTLLVPNLPLQLTTTKDVLKSDLKILGVTDIISEAIPYFTDKYNFSQRRLRYIDKKISYEEWIYRMTVKKDSAYLGFKEIIKYHTDRTELMKKIYIPETCVLKYMLAFILKKNSHLTETFLRFSNRLNENGFSKHFMRKHLSRESKWNIPNKIINHMKPLKNNMGDLPPSIKMNKMYVVFMFLAAGNGIAFLVFLIEVIKKWNRRKIRALILKLINFMNLL